MNKFIGLVISGSIFLFTTVFGAQPTSQKSDSFSAIKTRPIERGGSINSIDVTRGIIVINGMTYALSRASVQIHPLAGRLTDKTIVLKSGMDVRFNTVKVNATALEQVVEIWVVKTS